MTPILKYQCIVCLQTVDTKFHGSFHFGFSEMEYDQHYGCRRSGLDDTVSGIRWFRRWPVGDHQYSWFGWTQCWAGQLGSGRQERIGHSIASSRPRAFGIFDLATQAGQAAEIGSLYAVCAAASWRDATGIAGAAHTRLPEAQKQLKIMRNEILPVMVTDLRLVELWKASTFQLNLASKAQSSKIHRKVCSQHWKKRISDVFKRRKNAKGEYHGAQSLSLRRDSHRLA